MAHQKSIKWIGVRLGSLVVVSRAESRKGTTYWLCDCDCGRQKEIASGNLKTSGSCGCMKVAKRSESKAMKLAGRRFGKWVAVRRSDGRWFCECDCGNFGMVSATRLVGGMSKSCGCVRGSKKPIYTGRSIGSGWTLVEPRGGTGWLCRHESGAERFVGYQIIYNKLDPVKKLVSSCRSRIRSAMKMASLQKRSGTLELVGCTGAELAQHISSQFAPGMAMENHGEWHIDHIKPVAVFDMSDESQVRECFHYTNLQPLWATENKRKGKSHDPPK